MEWETGWDCLFLNGMGFELGWIAFFDQNRNVIAKNSVKNAKFGPKQDRWNGTRNGMGLPFLNGMGFELGWIAFFTKIVMLLPKTLSKMPNLDQKQDRLNGTRNGMGLPFLNRMGFVFWTEWDLDRTRWAFLNGTRFGWDENAFL